MYANKLRSSPPSSAIAEVERVDADKQVRVDEAKAMYFEVVGSLPPKSSRKEVFEWLRRSVARDQIYAEKAAAILPG